MTISYDKIMIVCLDTPDLLTELKSTGEVAEDTMGDGFFSVTDIEIMMEDLVDQGLEPSEELQELKRNIPSDVGYIHIYTKPTGVMS